VTPHEDIRKGRLVNRWAVVQGAAAEVYLDPDKFLRNTYLPDDRIADGSESCCCLWETSVEDEEWIFRR